MLQLTDADLLLRLEDTEDSTVERKSASDYRDCLKAAVAFSNSLPFSDPGIIFVGVYDDGRVQENNNLESIQRKVSGEIKRIYPPIYPQLKVMKKGGREFLSVIVRGSPERPHFAGQAYVRTGTETVAASEQQFSRLIAERNSKAREILRWGGKDITFRLAEGRHIIVGSAVHTGSSFCRVLDCNQFFVTLQFGSNETVDRAYSLAFIEIGYDCEHDHLELIEIQH
jgi:hypothetical protein